MRYLIFVICCFFLTAASDGSPLSVERLLRTLLALVFVCALAVVSIRFLAKRMPEQKAMQKKDSQPTRRLEVVDRATLSAKAEVVLLAVDGQEELIFAVDPKGATLLGIRRGSEAIQVVEEGTVLEDLETVLSAKQKLH